MAVSVSSTLGWFSKVLTLDIELDGPYTRDSGEEFVIPWDSFTGTVSQFDVEGNISGKVKIKVQDGVKIWHTGVKV
jgi:hypothetical protein